MSLIRSRGNKDTEVVLAKIFRAHKISGWRRHLQLKIKTFRIKSFQPFALTSSFPKYVSRSSLTVVSGMAARSTAPNPRAMPRSGKKKFATNIARDRLVNRTLRSANWRVLRIWEHELARKRQAASPAACKPSIPPDSVCVNLWIKMGMRGRGWQSQGGWRMGDGGWRMAKIAGASFTEDGFLLFRIFFGWTANVQPGGVRFGA